MPGDCSPDGCAKPPYAAVDRCVGDVKVLCLLSHDRANFRPGDPGPRVINPFVQFLDGQVGVHLSMHLLEIEPDGVPDVEPPMLVHRDWWGRSQDHQEQWCSSQRMVQHRHVLAGQLSSLELGLMRLASTKT